MKRSRGRGRRSGGGNPNRAMESNGPDVKIRGAASTIYEKYLQLGRDAATSGDRVKAENYLQHAEHYYRLMAASQPRPSEMQNGGEDEEEADGGYDQSSADSEGDGSNGPRPPRRRRPRRPAGEGDGSEDAPAAEAESGVALDKAGDSVGETAEHA